MTKNGVYFIVSQCGHKVMTMWIQSDDKIWDICASTKSTGLKFCQVDVLQELHIVIGL